MLLQGLGMRASTAWGALVRRRTAAVDMANADGDLRESWRGMLQVVAAEALGGLGARRAGRGALGAGRRSCRAGAGAAWARLCWVGSEAGDSGEAAAEAEGEERHALHFLTPSATRILALPSLQCRGSDSRGGVGARRAKGAAAAAPLPPHFHYWKGCGGLGGKYQAVGQPSLPATPPSWPYSKSCPVSG